MSDKRKYSYICLHQNLKSFAFQKDTVKEMKNKATDWEKIFANIYPKKDLYLEYKSLYNSTMRRQTTQSKNGQAFKHFIKEDV